MEQQKIEQPEWIVVLKKMFESEIEKNKRNNCHSINNNKSTNSDD
jgi:hypothetical protein